MSSIRGQITLARLTGFCCVPSIAAMMKIFCVGLLISLIPGLAHFKSHAELANGVKVVVDESAITYGEIASDASVVAGELLRQYGRQPALYQQKIMEAEKDSMERAVQQQLMLHEYKVMGYSIPDSIIPSAGCYLRKVATTGKRPLHCATTPGEKHLPGVNRFAA